MSCSFYFFGTSGRFARFINFYVDRAGLMVAAIDQDSTTDKNLAVGRPTRLMNEPFGSGGVEESFSVAGDGQRFLVAHLPPESRPRMLSVVVNWFAELEKVGPAVR